MGINLKKYKVSEITEIIGGGTPKTSISEYWNGNIPWLSVVDFCGDQKKVYKTEKTITEKGLNESSTKVLRKGQLIISARGTVGELGMLGKDMAFNQSCYGLNGIRGKITNDFLYYLIKYNLDSIKRKTHGAVFDTITKQTFDQIEVDVPDLPTQTRIASILSSLDDKIELNRRMNHTLEQMAQALFNHYFVDNIDPDNLPEGWRWGKLGEVSVNIRTNVNRNQIDEQSYYIGLEHLPRKSLALYNLGKADKLESNKFKFKENNILFGKLRPYFHKVVFAPFNGICSTDILVIEPSQKQYFSFCLLHLFSDSLIQYSNQFSDGTRMPRVNWHSLSDYEVAIPPIRFATHFNNMVTPLFEKVKQGIREIKLLASLRDTLLPKLMSGEIDIDKVMDEEQVIENELADCKTA